MTVWIDTEWEYRGLRVVRLENEVIRIDILPELGAKIWNLVHKPTGRNLLWHNPSLPLGRQVYGAPFDHTWSGGWDELVPNDVPTEVAYGDVLPDHGEVWSQVSEWEVLDAGPDVASVRFVNTGRVYATRFEKTVELKSGESLLHLAYRYANCGLIPIDFMWNIHPALQMSAASRTDLPAHRGITDPWSTVFCDGGTEFEWPFLQDRAGQPVDLRFMPPEGTLADVNVYLSNVREGWYAVTDTDTGIGFGMVFPTDVLPHLWIFRPTGGWRGLYTQIVEVSNGLSTKLAVGRETGNCGHLEPGESLEAAVLAVVYTGVSSVTSIEPDGRVIGPAVAANG